MVLGSAPDRTSSAGQIFVLNTVLVDHFFPTDPSLQIVQGDITLEEVDAIVNAGNEHLQHGGAVAWAISKKGGSAIQKESEAWIGQHGRVQHSAPAWTSGAIGKRRDIHADQGVR